MESRTVPWFSAKQHACTRLRCRAQHARATRSRHKFPRDLENQENLENQVLSMVLGFSSTRVQLREPSSVSSPETWKTRKTWKTMVFNGFGPFQHPGTTTGTVQRKFPRDLENQKNLENQVCPWFWAFRAPGYNYGNRPA